MMETNLSLSRFVQLSKNVSITIYMFNIIMYLINCPIVKGPVDTAEAGFCYN